MSEHINLHNAIGGISGNASNAMRRILVERERQEKKWGQQNHDPFTYLTILTEEIGELAQAALHNRFGGEASEDMMTEAIHAAAVAMAIIECLDRAKWKWTTIQQQL